MTLLLVYGGTFTTLYDATFSLWRYTCIFEAFMTLLLQCYFYGTTFTTLRLVYIILEATFMTLLLRRNYLCSG